MGKRRTIYVPIKRDTGDYEDGGGVADARRSAERAPWSDEDTAAGLEKALPKEWVRRMRVNFVEFVEHDIGPDGYGKAVFHAQCEIPDELFWPARIRLKYPDGDLSHILNAGPEELFWLKLISLDKSDVATGLVDELIDGYSDSFLDHVGERIALYLKSAKTIYSDRVADRLKQLMADREE